MNAPKQIWICVPGKDAPDWVVEHMTSGDIAANGSFEIEAADGPVTVEPGFAVFTFGEIIYACPTKDIEKTLAGAAGTDNEVVADLVARRETSSAKRSDDGRARRSAALAKVRGDKPLNLKPMIGSPPSPQFVAVEDLKVDDTYQRSIEGGASQRLIVKIAENWDWRLCLPLLVSRRNGELFVIDGQHRKEAAELRGDIVHLPVVVFDFDDPKAEAELFVQANRSRRNMSTLDDFHAAVVAGDAKSVVINDLVMRCGLTVGRNPAWQYWKPGEVVFIAAIRRALNSYGEDQVERVLAMIARAFEGLVLVGVGALFEAVCAFIKERVDANNPVDDQLLEIMLAEVGIAGWKEATAAVNDGRERAETMLQAVRANYAEAEAE